ncbi:MAG: hypothetical protein CMJ20_01810 [Phycisphaeraceae bacterium]|nr:hypothetical protein [Phycisphaeraceae bacterium]|tara:strand:- start:8255 stop:8503 length:249 start_codon:yes stop_codon:yes gene_type:complete
MTKQEIAKDEVDTWLACHGVPLTLGLLVETTRECELKAARGIHLTITSLKMDRVGVRIGVSTGLGIRTEYNEFRIDDLRPVV